MLVQPWMDTLTEVYLRYERYIISVGHCANTHKQEMKLINEYTHTKSA